MRHIILLDTKVRTKDYQKWVEEDTAFWEEHLGITPTYTPIREDYSDYPTYKDSDGDIRPTDAYLQSLNNKAIKAEGEFGTDFVMVMIHQDNWKSDTTPDIKGDGIWGTNYSYIFGKQCLDYCRWDSRNPNNTFGTAYHERHHSFDAIIKQETGVDIEPILGVKGYDYSITHGNAKPWKYIRYKENIDSLKVMKPYLVKAFEVRKKRYTDTMGLLGTIVTLATQLVYLLKMQQNKKDGVPRL